MTGAARRRAGLVLAAVLTFGAAVPASARQVDPDVGDGAVGATSTLVAPPTPVIDELPAGWPQAPDVGVPIHLLVEADTGQVLAAERADERRAVASTVKLLTALTASARSDPDDVVTVGPEVAGIEGASVQLAPGERWTVEQLVEGLLVRSGNDAAEALATHVGGDTEGFLEAMRDDAAVLGLPTDGDDGVVLASPSGLGDANRLSASDLGVIGRAVLADASLRDVVALPEVTLPGTGTEPNRNLLIGSLPGATGLKTGFTEAAGNSLVGSASRGGRDLVVVVLGGGADPERFTDAAALLDHGFAAFERVTVSASRTLLVAGGGRAVEVDDVTITVPTGADAAVDLPTPVRVPDDPAALTGAEITVDGEVVAPLVATVGDGPGSATTPAARVGRGTVDGIHAALRAASEAGRLTAP